MAQHDYQSVFKKDPFTVSLKVDTLKQGEYLVEGEVSEENWFEACDQAKVSHGGHCTASLVVKKTSFSLEISGKANVSMLRECARTMEEFESDESFEFDERLYLNPINEEEEADAFEGDTLNVADYLTQQVIIHMKQFPVSPATLASGDGAFDVVDGQQDEVDEKKNPFSVLKSLKSDS